MKPFDEELISAYIDNELSEDERREVERWLTESPEHRRLYEELASIHQRLSELPRHQLHGDYVEPVVREIRENPTLAPAAPLRTTWPPNAATVETSATAMKDSPVNRWSSWPGWTVVGVVAAAATVLVVLSLPDSRQGDLAQSDSTDSAKLLSSESTMMPEASMAEEPMAETPMAEEASGMNLEQAESLTGAEAAAPAMSSPSEPPAASILRQNAASADMPADAFSTGRGGGLAGGARGDSASGDKASRDSASGRGAFGGGLAMPAEKSAARNSQSLGAGGSGDRSPGSFSAPATSAVDTKPTTANEFNRAAIEAESAGAGQAGSPGARALRAEPAPVGTMSAAVGSAAGEPLPGVNVPIESQNRIAERPRSGSSALRAGLPAADVVVFVTIEPDRLAEMLRQRELRELDASESLANGQLGREPTTGKSTVSSQDDQRMRRQAADLGPAPDAAESSPAKPATSSAIANAESEEVAAFDEAVYVAADAEMLARLVRQIAERPASQLTIEPVNESAGALRFSQTFAKQRSEPTALPVDKPVDKDAAPEKRQPQRDVRKSDDDAVQTIENPANAPVPVEPLKENPIAAEKKTDPAPVAGATTLPSTNGPESRPVVRFYFKRSGPPEEVADANDGSAAEAKSESASARASLADEARPLRVLFLLRSPAAPNNPQ